MTDRAMQTFTRLDERFIYRPYPVNMSKKEHSLTALGFYSNKADAPDKEYNWGLYPLGFENANDYTLRIRYGTAWKLEYNPIRILIAPYTPYNDKRYQGRITLYIKPRREVEGSIQTSQGPQTQFVSAVTSTLMPYSSHGQGVPGFPLYSGRYYNKPEFIELLNYYLELLHTKSDSLAIEAAIRGY